MRKETNMRTRSALRIPCHSWADATEFSLRLRADGYVVRRTWKTVIAYTGTPEEAECLARKLGLAAQVKPPRTRLVGGIGMRLRPKFARSTDGAAARRPT
jgi:hypothetical protein